MSLIEGLSEHRKLIRQAEAGECGLACLAMVARHHGEQGELSGLRRRFPLSSRGSSLKDLVTIADQMGFHTRALQCGIASLDQLATPAILHWDLNHYVVLDRARRGARGGKYTILDPARGLQTLEDEELSEHFTGIALELTPSTNFTPARQRDRLRLTQLWTRVSGLGPALLRILILSSIMQVVTLIMPFFTQLAIDTALPGSDLDLLNIIAIGFGALVFLNAMTSWVRARLVISLSNSLSLQTAANLFRHTIFLPSAWFEKRHLGDVVSRFGSLQPITDLLSRGLVSAVVDGILALSTLALMVIYSPVLTALTGCVVLLYVAVKLLFFQSMKLANTNLLTAQAIESSAFLENVRGISAIKIFCQEGNRQRLWQNKKADVVNGSIRLGRITSGFDTTNAFIVAIENILFIYLAIKMVMAGEISLGMLFAFQAYKQNFVGALTRLIDQSLNYRLLDVHLDRLSDIAFEAREPDASPPVLAPCGVVEVQNVSYSYGLGLPLVLDQMFMRIEPGKTTVIIGASGSGKTTLLKILSGLLQPTSGRVLIDGVPMWEFGTRSYRGRLGVVSQEDTLFAGTLAENIAFFDPDYDMDWIVECCRQAAIHDDIAKMPMKYETMVGDMGSNLSGGQKQRVLLARALYKKPDILLLDEGTAHLDVVTEAKVVSALKALRMTRLLVAHRPETIRMADVIYQMSNGRTARILSMDQEENTVTPMVLQREAE
ncbi:hypothetical protein AWL63_18390 [Sphingomonas panacis]|uniref:ABC transporter n=1 Tax=Sphingomonas panacis TaxID=1560345 RepID=A0A1B3ZDV0_9SPHN|nr:peptidase domain-containing ABC transporter [Sphingomonas panacis]AOH85611.1 hypothetical protein AWL63_18390 [Sphingomonas panacis]